MSHTLNLLSENWRESMVLKILQKEGEKLPGDLVDLTLPNPDYDQVVLAIFEAEAVHVW